MIIRVKVNLEILQKNDNIENSKVDDVIDNLKEKYGNKIITKAKIPKIKIVFIKLP